MARKATPDPDTVSATDNEDRRLWNRVISTVKPIVRNPGNGPAPVIMVQASMSPALSGTKSANHAGLTAPVSTDLTQPLPSPFVARVRHAADVLEPRRQRRLSRERDPIEAKLDLHGFGRFEAEDRLVSFLNGAAQRGHRSVLVITGQGRRGGGVIRASFVEWLQSPRLRPVVSGFSAAHRRHGGDGAFYVTLKRREV